jgi:hypothetical protein
MKQVHLSNTITGVPLNTSFLTMNIMEAEYEPNFVDSEHVAPFVLLSSACSPLRVGSYL